LAAAEAYEKEKKAKYAPTCQQKNLIYIPVVGECTGAWSDSAHKLFAYLIKALAYRRRLKFGVQKRMFYEDLSVILQRQNVNAILRRDPYSDIY
jgi:hypothetical protein